MSVIAGIYNWSPILWIIGAAIASLATGLFIGWISVPDWIKRHQKTTIFLAAFSAIATVALGSVVERIATEANEAVTIEVATKPLSSNQTPYTITTRPLTPAINTVSNNLVLGDEKNFIRVAKGDDPADSDFTDKVTLKSNEKLTFRIYIHNDADSSSGATATGVNARFFVPTYFTDHINDSSDIRFDQGEVSAEYSVSTDNVHIRLIPTGDPIRFINSKLGDKGYIVNNNLFSARGTAIGCTSQDGLLPASADCDGYIEIPMRVELEPTIPTISEYTSTTWIRIGENGEWVENLTVKPNDEAEIFWEIANSGTAPLDDVNLYVSFTHLSPTENVAHIREQPNKDLMDVEIGSLADKSYSATRVSPNENLTLRTKVKMLAPEHFETCGINDAWVYIEATPKNQLPTMKWATFKVNVPC